MSTNQPEGASGTDQNRLASKLGGIGWALFLMWIGIALLANFGAGVTLLGIGVITLGVQMTRRSLGLSLENFWVVVGVLFVLAGVWDFVMGEVSLLPVLLIAAGAVALLSLLRR